MSDQPNTNPPPVTYQTVSGGVLGLPERVGGLYTGVIMRGGLAHPITVMEQPDAEGLVLVSGATFYGRVPVAQVIPSE